MKLQNKRDHIPPRIAAVRLCMLPIRVREEREEIGETSPEPLLEAAGAFVRCRGSSPCRPERLNLLPGVNTVRGKCDELLPPRSGNDRCPNQEPHIPRLVVHESETVSQ